MSRSRLFFALPLLAILSPPRALAANYADGLAPPGAPASAFPGPGRPVAGIVTDIWKDEQSRDRAGEAERVMNLLGVRAGLSVADIGAGKQAAVHGTPPDLLRCELAAVGYRQTAFYDLQEGTYLAVFELQKPGPAKPSAIRPCSRVVDRKP